MDNPTYVGLTRQSGLMREMQVVANNIANMATHWLPPRRRDLRRACGRDRPRGPQSVHG